MKSGDNYSNEEALPSIGHFALRRAFQTDSVADLTCNIILAFTFGWTVGFASAVIFLIRV